MDNVYEVFTTPREQTGLQGIHFRFFPDMSQVQHALQVRRTRGRTGWLLCAEGAGRELAGVCCTEQRSGSSVLRGMGGLG
jgi:hypothetical protein